LSQIVHLVGLWMAAHMACALVLGWVVGYERYFSGRASGSQVYCLVCATSCAVTLLAGYPALWYWGTSHDSGGGDPTRVIGAILTGIGFLGAGIIVQTGLNVRGLTTAASIWASSAIGILVGVGFYLAAVGLTALIVISMSVVPRLARRLPARAAMEGKVRFCEGFRPDPVEIHRYLAERGLLIPSDTLSITHSQGRFELQCLIFGDSGTSTDAMSRIVLELSEMPEVEEFTVTHSSRA
jgi:putative Mg2+ transporter-C (MgtC) family protein